MNLFFYFLCVCCGIVLLIIQSYQSNFKFDGLKSFKYCLNSNVYYYCFYDIDLYCRNVYKDIFKFNGR